MSEVINNRQYRQKVLRQLIMELHEGKSVDEVKARFEKLIEGVSPSEISEMEQGLIMEGMPVSEVQRLCDVHAAVFKGSIEQIHNPEQMPGHPIHTFKAENREIEKLVNEKIKPNIEKFKSDDSIENKNALLEDFRLLASIDNHYKRKENLIFPILEKHEVTGPPKVMWGVDDEIRDAIKEVLKLLSDYNDDRESVAIKAGEAADRVLEMVFKEENILFPMTIEMFSEDEWISVYEDSDDIGYTLTEPKGKWEPVRVKMDDKEIIYSDREVKSGYIKFDTGMLSVEEINAIFNTLPVDITFVGKDGIVKYFSNSKDRIFARTKAVIGRTVQNCHPPASVHIVEKIVEDLLSGRKDHEDFWIRMGDKYVYIRYFAVRDEDDKFLGILEVTQDIKPIRELEGERRLLSD